MTEPASFGDLLRTRRVAAGLTQEQLAERSGLGVRTIRDLERGRVRRPHRESVELLAAALGLPDDARHELARAGHQGIGRAIVPAAAGGPGGAPAAGAADPAAARPAASVPRQLPPAIPHFAGRDDALAELDGLLRREAAGRETVIISAIGGTAGIGKTALAVHWAHQVAGQFPDGQLYVNLRGYAASGPPVTPAEAIRGFLDAFGVPPGQIPPDDAAQAARYRSLLAGRRVLVLLDNARDAAQVRPMLPGSPGCLVVVTSRSQLLGLVAGDGARPLTLDLLTEAEARDLLERQLGPHAPASDEAATRELIGLCARLPLALSIAAARAATEPGRPLADLAAQLRNARSRLDTLGTGDPATDMRAVFSWSYQDLTAPAARLLRLLGLHPGPDVSAPAAASLAGLPLGRASQGLAELTRAHLIAQQPGGRFAFHDLLRAYASELATWADGQAEIRAALRRLLDHYLHTAAAGARLLAPTRSQITLSPAAAGTLPEPLDRDTDAISWFETERAVLLASVTLASESGFDAQAWQLSWCVSDFLIRGGYWQAYLASQNTGLAAARRLGDLAGQARCHGELGYAHGRLGAFAEGQAHLQQALEAYRRLDEPSNQIRMHMAMSHLLEWEGRVGEAREPALRALELSRAAGYRFVEANALNDVGWYNALLGDYAEALACCEQALELFREFGDRYGVAVTLDSLGYARHRLGHRREALTCYQQAIAGFRELKDRYYEAGALIKLGDVHRDDGYAEAAREAWQQALVIMSELGHPDAADVRSRLSRLPETSR